MKSIDDNEYANKYFKSVVAANRLTALASLIPFILIILNL